MDRAHDALPEEQHEVARDRRADPRQQREPEPDPAGGRRRDRRQRAAVAAIDERTRRNEQQHDRKDLDQADTGQHQLVVSALVQLPQHGRADHRASKRVQRPRADQLGDHVVDLHQVDQTTSAIRGGSSRQGSITRSSCSRGHRRPWSMERRRRAVEL
jgi:hypothetical protein